MRTLDPTVKELMDEQGEGQHVCSGEHRRERDRRDATRAGLLRTSMRRGDQKRRQQGKGGSGNPNLSMGGRIDAFAIVLDCLGDAAGVTPA